MRGAFVAMLLGACGYTPTPASGSGEPGTDAAGPGMDSAVGNDAGIDDAEPQWTLIETLNIPIGFGQQVTSQTSLANGVTYHLRAHGTFVIDNIANTLGDAEYYDFSQQTPYDITPIGSPVDVGIGIDDATVDASKNPRWGAFTMTHVYEASFTGKGTPIKANVHDGNYTNDAGSLDVDILELR